MIQVSNWKSAEEPHIKTYSQWAQIGIESAPPTISEVVEKLPANSVIIESVEGGQTDLCPVQNGTIVIRNEGGNKLIFTFYSKNDTDIWVGSYDETWHGWHTMAKKDEVLPIVNPNATTSIKFNDSRAILAGPDSTGNSNGYYYTYIDSMRKGGKVAKDNEYVRFQIRHNDNGFDKESLKLINFDANGAATHYQIYGQHNNADFEIKNGGKSLATGVDLKTITTFGNYFCESNANAATMKNCPVKEAFTLFVYPSIGVGTTYRSYKLETYNGVVYFMKYDGHNKVWQDWQLVYSGNGLATVIQDLIKKGSISMVKSVQRGTITIPVNGYSATATITAVNMNKAVVIYGGYDGYVLNQYDVKLDLTNSTTVTASSKSKFTMNNADVPYQVIEFY